jgi:hypothetical protein
MEAANEDRVTSDAQPAAGQANPLFEFSVCEVVVRDFKNQRKNNCNCLQGSNFAFSNLEPLQDMIWEKYSYIFINSVLASFK